VKRRVVIVGGDAGVAELAAGLSRQSQKLKMMAALVECASQHLWKPHLHEVAVGALGQQEWNSVKPEMISGAVRRAVEAFMSGYQRR